MKRFLVLSLITIIVGIPLFSQMMKYPNLKKTNYIKNSTLIVATIEGSHKKLKEYQNKPNRLEMYNKYIDAYNANLVEAVKSAWNFTDSSKIIAMPLKDAKKLARKGDYAILNVGSTNSWSLPSSYGNWDVTYITYGRHMEILIPGKSIKIFLPQFNGFLTKDIAIYGVNQIQYFLRKSEEIGGFGYADWIRKGVKPNYKKIKDVTLLVPEEWCILSEEEIKELYRYDFEMMPYDSIRKKILNKEKGYASVMIVPVPFGDHYDYFQYYYNIESGMVYNIIYDTFNIGLKGGPYTGDRMAYLIKTSFKKIQEDIEEE
ncbi:MAG: hypothetical protein C0596_13825 [Marinilabiliales bacterium]|nr:MAG: hypothetical protein C0596_13825 [Marinilabiliales bacterium]